VLIPKKIGKGKKSSMDATTSQPDSNKNGEKGGGKVWSEKGRGNGVTATQQNLLPRENQKMGGTMGTGGGWEKIELLVQAHERKCWMASKGGQGGGGG